MCCNALDKTCYQPGLLNGKSPCRNDSKKRAFQIKESESWPEAELVSAPEEMLADSSAEGKGQWGEALASGRRAEQLKWHPSG